MDRGEATENSNLQSKGKGCGDWRQEVAWGLGACWLDAGGLRGFDRSSREAVLTPPSCRQETPAQQVLSKCLQKGEDEKIHPSQPHQLPLLIFQGQHWDAAPYQGSAWRWGRTPSPSPMQTEGG